MSETLTLPLSATGFVSALVMLFALTIGHAFADFPLQGDFLSRGKNRNSPPVQLADGRKGPENLWAYLMSAHCLIHSGFVWIITGNVILALAEGSEAERQIIASALGKVDASELEVSQVVAIFTRHNTLKRTLDKAHAHADAAIAALAPLPESEMKTILADVVRHSVGRAS